MLATSLQARVGLLDLLRPFTPPPARGQPNAARKTPVRHRGICASGFSLSRLTRPATGFAPKALRLQRHDRPIRLLFSKILAAEAPPLPAAG